jgi:hypothetical protein
MAHDSQDMRVPLDKAMVAMQPGDEARRCRVDAATLKLLPGRRVRLGFEGPKGSLAIELSRGTFWHITSLFHERSAAAEDAIEPSRRRRKRS